PCRSSRKPDRAQWGKRLAKAEGTPSSSHAAPLDTPEQYGPSGSGPDIGCGRRSFGQYRQAQGLRHHRQETVRRLARPADHGGARLQALAPAGTPRPIVDKLNSALRAALADAKVDKTFAEGGMDLYQEDEETPEAASALLKREIKLWGDVIRTNHIATQ